VNCPRCGAETQPGQKFCAECGHALSSACPNCGTAYEGAPKFCAECGYGLAATMPSARLPGGGDATPGSTLLTPAPPAAERRYISVLFADLVGFTALSESEDAEEVRDLLSRYFELARTTIEGYAGSVEKYIGDAVMAVWGAPVAREDDPERAVRAALELVERVRGLSIGGQPLALRAGVLSGEAAVTAGRTGEGMVAGDLVNTASRLQSVAPPGTVLVGESTYRATSRAIAYEPAGDQLLKGKQAPVACWRALRVVARVGGEGREEGLEPPFVGREEELRLLKDQLHAAEREHKLRMVAITGQAGIGKSRLIWELEKYLDGLASDRIFYWHRGRSPSYGEGIAFWALGEMVRRRARIAEGEDEAATRAKLQQTLAEYVVDSQERRILEPALGALLGIEEADWSAREQLFSAWRTFFERVADKGPTILAFEDLQWADEGLLDFIEHVLEWARDHPILIVTLARPELLERRANFGMGHRALAALHLEPLSAAAMAELLHGLVPNLGEDDLTRIVERAEGMPLYAVETIRSLVDTGQLVRRDDAYELVGELPKLDVPPTLRALIASRLDALEATDRALLQDAAVLGLAFTVNALASLNGRPPPEIEARLRGLAHKELVGLETDPRSPERGQYIFRQGLIREVAYTTLSKRERRVRHLAAARFYETLDDDELAGIRASHYVEAFRAAPEGEEGAAVAAQARVALRAAADRAARLHSHVQAADYYEQAMTVTFDVAELDELRLRAAHSAAVSGQLERAQPHYEAAIRSLGERGELERAASAEAELCSWLLAASRIDEAMQRLKAALEALPADAERALVHLNGQLARGHLFRGEGEAALVAVEKALQKAESLRRRAGEKVGLGAIGLGMLSTLQLLITKSWAMAQVGRAREGIALLYGVITLADAEDELSARTRARFNLSSYVVADDLHEALRIAREGLAISRQHGQAVQHAMVAGNAAEAALWIGDLDAVFEIEGEVPEAVGSLGSFVYGSAAVAAAMRGDRQGTQRRMEVVGEQVAGSTSAQDRVAWSGIQGMVAMAEGDLARARALSLQARDAFGAGQEEGFVIAGHAAVLTGDLDGLRADAAWYDANREPSKWFERSWRTIEAAKLALEGRTDEARAAYRKVIDEWRAANLPLNLGLALLERALLLGANDAEAAAGEQEAHEIFTSMGAGPFIERLRASAHRPTPLPARASRAQLPVPATD
jgi:class 3 adenylate cyclase/tetratricopeptide (TPR) repeat protein